MCNAHVISWFDEHLTRQEVACASVLEVGSRDINGSIRPALLAKGAAEYVGIDIQLGPGVDYACDACQLVEWFGFESFDIIVSTCALEHVRDLRGAVSNIKKVCRSEGLITLAVPDTWPRHDYPGDYWRFSLAGLAALFADCEEILLERHPIRAGRSLIFGKWRKPAVFRDRTIPLLLAPMERLLTGSRPKPDRAERGRLVQGIAACAPK